MFVFSRFDIERGSFYLKSLETGEEAISITSRISFRGLNEGTLVSVKTDLKVDNYDVGYFKNPFLNAQNDVYKLKSKINNSDRTIGFIFHSSALEDDAEEEEIDNFDIYKQAYKFYCLRKIIERHTWEINDIGKDFGIAEILQEGISYAITFVGNSPQSKLSNFLPSLALYGYYNLSIHERQDLSIILGLKSNDQSLKEIISSRFYYLRTQESLLLKDSGEVLTNHPLIKLMYVKLLAKADNPLYRFVLLYQIIEYLVDKSFRNELLRFVRDLQGNAGNDSSYKITQRLIQINNTRASINKLFSISGWEEKDEVTNIMKSFITEFDSDYSKSSTGDCFYDTRNILFHDYKSVLENNKDEALPGLIIQCEILIHKLVISLNDKLLINLPAIEDRTEEI